MNSGGDDTAHVSEGAMSTQTYSECHVFDAQFLHPWSIQLPQHAHDPGLLASTRWAIHKKVGEIPTLDLHQPKEEAMSVHRRPCCKRKLDPSMPTC